MDAISILEMLLTWLYWTLRELDPIPGDAGLGAMLPAGCREFEDYTAVQVITAWFNIILDIAGSTLRFPFQCVEVN